MKSRLVSGQMAKWLFLLALALIIIADASEAVGCPPRWRPRRCVYDQPCFPPRDQYPGHPGAHDRSPEIELPPALASAAAELRRLLTDKGFDLSILRDGSINPRKNDPLLFLAHWESLRPSIQSVLKRQLDLESDPSLEMLLLVREGDKDSRSPPPIVYFSFPDERNKRVQAVITKGLGAPDQVFARGKSVRLYQTRLIPLNRLRREFFKNDTLDVLLVTEAINNSIRTDVAKFLNQPMATEIPSRGPNLIRVMSTWTLAKQEENTRYYWRVNATMETNEPDKASWTLGVRLDIGYRTKSMSDIVWTGDHHDRPDLASALSTRIVAGKERVAKEEIVQVPASVMPEAGERVIGFATPANLTSLSPLTKTAVAISALIEGAVLEKGKK